MISNANCCRLLLIMRFVVKLNLRSNLMTTFENTILRELADLPERAVLMCWPTFAS